MKFMILLLFVSIAFNLCAQNDLKDFDLKGKVKSMRSKGDHRYRKNGTYTNWEKYYGQLVTFNPKGQKTEFSEFYGNDSLSYKIIYTYNPKDKNASVAYFNKQLQPTSSGMFYYNAKGQKTEEMQYKAPGQLNYRYTYAYDERGNLLEIVCYNGEGTLVNKTKFTYDQKNNRTGYKLETPGYATTIHSSAYDEKNNMIEEIWYDVKGAVDFRFVRAYDDKGNKIKEEKYRAGKLLDTIRWVYEYDKQGNWIKKTDLASDGTEYHVEYRTIVYY